MMPPMLPEKSFKSEISVNRIDDDKEVQVMHTIWFVKNIS
jgi:hypothetical protein